jgi:hypothetical protein
MYHFYCVVLSRVGTALVMGRFPIQGILPKCRKGFIVLEIIMKCNRPDGLISVMYKEARKSKLFMPKQFQGPHYSRA